MPIKLKQTTLFVVASLCLITSLVYTSSSFATDFCVTQECIDARKKAESFADKSLAATEAAKSLEEEIARLDKEIAAIEKEIANNQIIAKTLSEKITKTQAKLTEQQSALAELIVEMHFAGTPDAITLLAGSSTLADYTERQARADSIKSQISLSANAIKATKQTLEHQKDQVDALLEDEQTKRNQIAANRAEQDRLRKQYQADASSYASDAEKARKLMAEEIAKEIARTNNSGSVVASGVNSYPFQSRCPYQNWYFTDTYIYGYGGYICECTSYAGYKAYEYYGVTIGSWGNASSWGVSARAHGYTVSSVPKAHTVGYSGSGLYGHVVWVERVNGDGTIDLSEYNNPYSSASGSRADFGYRTHVYAGAYRYIYFD